MPGKASPMCQLPVKRRGDSGSNVVALYQGIEYVDVPVDLHIQPLQKLFQEAETNVKDPPLLLQCAQMRQRTPPSSQHHPRSAQLYSAASRFSRDQDRPADARVQTLPAPFSVIQEHSHTQNRSAPPRPPASASHTSRIPVPAMPHNRRNVSSQ